MKIKLQYLPEFTVTGILGRGKSSEGAKWVVPLWDKANAEYGKIKNTALKDESGSPKGTWGIMGNPGEFLGRWGEEGLYLAGCETEKDGRVPEGFTKWTVPAQTYLVADCGQAEYGAVFNSVITDYLPKHSLQMVGAAHEHYPEPGSPEHVELYFPVAKDYLYCQSCGMPMTGDEHLGSEASGGKNYDYCCYCYKNGDFTSSCSMEQMIDFCLDIEKDSGMYTVREAAKKEMIGWFPTLKRWKKAQ